MRLEFLKKKSTRLNGKISDLAKRALESQDANEVRSLNDQITELKEELAEVDEEIRSLEAPETTEVREHIPADAKKVGMETKASFTPEERAADIYASAEYRQAFKAFVQNGTAIPAKFEKRDAADTTSLGATIPTTVLNEFINEIRKVYGNLYDKTRKLNIRGSVKIPIAQLQAQFKWVSETTVSPRQDGGEIAEYVEFGYNLAEIRVAQTLLSSIVSLDLFEREIVQVMLVAYRQAMDIAIVKGTGIGQPLGILNDTRVTGQAGHIIELTAAEIGNWTAWRKKFFAKLPLGYRAGEFIFPLSTVDAYLSTMADGNNNPIFRQATGLEVNDGDLANPNGRFFGRDVSLVEPDVIADFDSASEGDVIGIFWQPEEYAINTNMAFGMRRWFDEDRNEWVNKMLTVVDGKVLNPKGIYIFKKKA